MSPNCFQVSFSCSGLCNTWKKIKVKMSYSLTAVGAVGLKVPLYLGHS